MKFLLRFAWKNLFRYSRRTLITAGAIAVGLCMYIFIDSLLAGADQESIINLRLYETSSAKIVHRENLVNIKKGKLEHLIEDPRPIFRILDDMKISYSPRVTFAAEAIVEDGSLFVSATGIDIQTDENVFQFKETIVEGRYPRAGTMEALLGDALAKNLKVKVGDFLTLKSRTPEGYYQAMDLEVTGLMSCPNPYVNKAALFLPLDVVDSLLFMEGRVSEIVLSYPEYGKIEEQLEPLRTELSSFSDITVADWKVLGSEFLAISTMKSAGTKVILFMVFVIAAVGISNTMLMAIFERIREIGMMRALGMKKNQIRLAFILEAGGIGLFGSLIGVGLGLISVWAAVTWGLDFREMIGDMDTGYRTAGIFWGVWNFGTMGAAFLAGILLSSFVAFFPTSKALKISITDALHHN